MLVAVAVEQDKRGKAPRQEVLGAMVEMVFRLASMDRLLHGLAVVVQDAHPRDLAARAVAATALMEIQVRQRKTAQ
jgi:hypothetical protein